MDSIALPSFRSIVAIAGLGMLCQCSLFFDLGTLSDAGPLGSDRSVGGDDGTRPSDLEAAALSDAAIEDAPEAAAPYSPPEDAGDAMRTETGTDSGPDTSTMDAAEDTGGDRGLAADVGSDSAIIDATLDAWTEAGADAPGMDAPPDGGGIAAALAALYLFDEPNGPTASDSSGHGHDATMQGATFAPGLHNNAATLSGSGSYVMLPGGIVGSSPSLSISAWVKLAAPPQMWSRICDFGNGTSSYLFLTAHSSSGTLRFAITTSGLPGEQRIDAPMLATGSWQHVAVTLVGTTGNLYVNGAPAAQNTAMTLNPTSLGATTQNWLGRSQFAVDPYLDGQIDNFRIYDRALSASEVALLYLQQL